MMGELLLQGGGVQLLEAFAGGSGKLEEQQPEEEEELYTTNSSSSSHWYFTKDQIDNNSPSRRDGIDLKKENYLRKSYCTFLQDLGMRLKEPQLTIATAIVFCHRFFLRQSHHKNDCHLIATVCMFLAGKVEDSPRPLQDVILMSYEIRFKKDPIAVQKIKQKHVFEAEKERVLLGEWLVLTTLGFDFNVHHPYKPLGATLRKLGMAKHPLAQVAWNFVNDGLRTSLCLQYKPHHVAAGAIFLATKFLKIKLTSEGDKLWWQEFEVTPRQLEDVSNQMLELYEQDKKGMSSRMSDPSSSTGPNTPKKGTASTDLPDVAGCPCPVLPPGQMKPELLEDKKKYNKIVEAVTGDMTEAHSSLEEGENVAESKPATFEIPGTAAFLTNTSRTSSKGQHSAVKVSKVVLRPTEKSLKQTPVYRDKLNMDVREGTGKPCRARGEVPLDTYPLMKPTNEEGEEETATNPVLQERKVKVISKIVHNLPGTLQDHGEGEIIIADDATLEKCDSIFVGGIGKGMFGSAERGMTPDNMENKLQTSHRELPALEQHDAKYPADVAEEEKHMDQEAIVYGRVDLQLQGMKSEPAVRGDSDHMDAVGGGQGNAISRGICKLEWTCVAKQDYNVNIASGIVVYEFRGVRKMQMTKQGTDLSGWPLEKQTLLFPLWV